MCFVWLVGGSYRSDNEEQSIYRCPCVNVNNSYSLRPVDVSDVLCFPIDTKVRVLEGLLNNRMWN